MSQCAKVDDEPIWVSVPKALSLTSIGRTKLYELLNSGQLQSTKLGGKRLISYESIRQLDRAA